MGSGASEGVHRREGIRLFHQDLLSPLGVGAGSEERLKQLVCNRAGVRLGDQIWRRGILEDLLS